jgi:hypothetical protein
MKTKISYFKPFFTAMVLCMLAALSSCKKNPAVGSPSFDVTVDSLNYKVGDQVVFKITGDADLITFYSGTTGNQYINSTRTTIQGSPQMQFTSYRQFGPQNNTIHLLASTDFNGSYDVPSVQIATWTDITARATFSTGTNNTPSGVVDLSDLSKDGAPIYIAFKYTAIDTTVSQPTWTINNLVVNNKQADGTLVSVGTLANLSWGSVNVAGAQIWTFSTTQLQMAGGAIGTPDNEDWVISKQIFPNRVARDLGLIVKTNPIAIPLPTYPYIYTVAGTYTATFVAQNNSAWDSKTTVKQFIITVK